MSQSPICVVCMQPIQNPNPEVRYYRIKATGKTIPQRCCGDACWAKHAALKAGLSGPVHIR